MYKRQVLGDVCGDVIHDQKDDNVSLVHKVRIDKNSKLYNIIGKEEISVNSFHNHHATENDVYVVTSRSEDGLIEGIEYPSSTFNIGVQWHPEISYEFDEYSKKVIDAFIQAATIRGKQRIMVSEKI